MDLLLPGEIPHVQYNLWNGNSDHVNTRVAKGLCEVAMITAPYNKEGFEVLPVCKEPWVALLPHEHPLAKLPGDSVTPEQLLPYDLLIPSRESRKHEIDQWFLGTGQKPIIRGRIAHMVNAYELSLHGVGVSIYPASISSLIRPMSSASKKSATRTPMLLTPSSGVRIISCPMWLKNSSFMWKTDSHSSLRPEHSRNFFHAIQAGWEVYTQAAIQAV
ncbi:MAG: LysR family transcriptional regulator substrate-binding protein [Eubacteriales bacterium]